MTRDLLSLLKHKRELSDSELKLEHVILFTNTTISITEHSQHGKWFECYPKDKSIVYIPVIGQQAHAWQTIMQVFQISPKYNIVSRINN